MSTIDEGTTWQMDVLDDYLPALCFYDIDYLESFHAWAAGLTGLLLETEFYVNIQEGQNGFSIQSHSVELDCIVSPNPFTTSTTLSYTLDQPGNVQFKIYTLQGQIVFSMQERQDKGEQKVQWNAEGLPAGMYYFRIQAGEVVGSGKMIKISGL
ncbi:MAG: T9SS type A sorting domain-containing protein [Bacteroidota bacterium]|nr:T9SS type A sorting domain-containing protein [Bacteroidota bacterium]